MFNVLFTATVVFIAACICMVAYDYCVMEEIDEEYDYEYEF